tara:strand:- start:1044 stop:1349 length:306 start_codon:yes stop_codon:yes gene_type:complete
MTTTTAPAKPRRRAKRGRKQAPAIMNQQAPLKVEVPSKTVDLVKPDVQLITLQEYRADFQKRLKIHDYEVTILMGDIKKATTWIVNQTKQIINRIKTVELK